MCITKGTEGLVVIVVDRTYASAHHRFGVATQRILQGQAWHEVCLRGFLVNIHSTRFPDMYTKKKNKNNQIPSNAHEISWSDVCVVVKQIQTVYVQPLWLMFWLIFKLRSPAAVWWALNHGRGWRKSWNPPRLKWRCPRRSRTCWSSWLPGGINRWGVPWSSIPQNGCFIMENPIKSKHVIWYDLGYPHVRTFQNIEEYWIYRILKTQGVKTDTRVVTLHASNILRIMLGLSWSFMGSPQDIPSCSGLQCVSGGASLALPFWTGQVHHVHLSHPNGILAI